MHVLVLRDRRESVKKCSLTPLRGLPGIRFVDYDPDATLEVAGRVLLDPEGEELGPADRGADLLLVDCAWRRVPKLVRTLRGEVRRRRLPRLETAYPRKSRIFDDPGTGLASVEALYAASVLLGEPHPEWLDGYRWTSQFLAANPALAGAAPGETPATGDARS